MAVFVLPYILLKAELGIAINFKGEVLDYIEITMDNIPTTTISVITGAVLSGVLCMKFREDNKERVFNKGNVYKTQSFVWYKFCAEVLGYRKCCMKRVPIVRQIQLILDDTFEEFIYDKLKENDTIEIECEWKIPLGNTTEINVMLADTYPLDIQQITNNKNLPTLIIRRKDITNNNHYYVPHFCELVLSKINNLPKEITTVNLYATTNVIHTKIITEDVFKKAGRGNIENLRVYQQEKHGNRKFEVKGTEIRL